MACYSPLQAFQSIAVSSKGKSRIVFNKPRDFYNFKEVQLPCGQCIGCRLERSRQWAVRLMHESKLHDDNCFITLTYSDDFLPKDKSLDVRDFQLFMKRLRKHFGKGVRFFHCGEYGDKYGRPHYHAIIFGVDFSDKILWKVNNGHRLYRSELLESLWPFGHSSIGNVTFESAAYVARYILKKKLGKGSWLHYAEVDFSTGEVLFERKKEYTTMSRRSGIGKGWLDKYLEDVYPSDAVVVNGRKCRPPRYYDSLYEIQYPSDFSSLKQRRVENAKKHSTNNTPERLKVREQCQLSRLVRLPRVLE